MVRAIREYVEPEVSDEVVARVPEAIKEVSQGRGPKPNKSPAIGRPPTAAPRNPPTTANHPPLTLPLPHQVLRDEAFNFYEKKGVVPTELTIHQFKRLLRVLELRPPDDPDAPPKTAEAEET